MLTRWYWRIGALVALAFRAMAIGYGMCFIIIRPWLTVRFRNERPFPSVFDAVRIMIKGLPSE